MIKNSILKKIGATALAMGLMCSIFGGTVYAVQSDWYTYHTGPGATYPTDVISLKFNNPVTNYVKANSVTGSGAKVIVSGVNVNMYDIPACSYTTYTFTALKLGEKIFRPYSKTTTDPSVGTYKCVSSGSGTYYSSGYIKY